MHLSIHKLTLKYRLCSSLEIMEFNMAKSRIFTIYRLEVLNKCYFGQTTLTLNERVSIHKIDCYIKKCNSTLYRWIRDNGITQTNWNDFVKAEVIDMAVTQFAADELESHWIHRQYKLDSSILLNTKSGGNSSFLIENVFFPGYRKCTDCDEVKSFSNFNKSKPYPGGYYNICKSCRSIRNKEITEKKRELKQIEIANKLAV